VNEFLPNLEEKNVPRMDIINPDKLCANLFKGFDFTGVKVSIFSIGNWRRRYNSAALLRSLWFPVFGGRIPNVPNLVKIRSWGLLGKRWNITFCVTIYLFSRTNVEKRPLHGFWCLMAQKTRNRA